MRSFLFLPAFVLLLSATGCDNRPVQKQAELPLSQPSPMPNSAPTATATPAVENPQESAGPAVTPAAKKKQQPMLVARIEQGPGGTTIHATYVFINNITVPGITESMADPQLTGVFRNDELAFNEMLICDGGAGTKEMVEASCQPISNKDSPALERLLTSAFKAHREKVWKPLGDDLGITNTS